MIMEVNDVVVNGVHGGVYYVEPELIAVCGNGERLRMITRRC